jgi:hypothetical protein
LENQSSDNACNDKKNHPQSQRKSESQQGDLGIIPQKKEGNGLFILQKKDKSRTEKQ